MLSRLRAVARGTARDLNLRQCRIDIDLRACSVIIVHHLNNSRSQRILWLLEELGVAYEVKRYERNKVTMLAPPELRAVHPLGKSPVITDGTTTVAESGAIVEYLVEKYGDGRLIPKPGTPDRLRYTYWLHFAEGSGMPPLLMQLVFNRIESAPMPFFARPIAKAIAGKVKKSFIEPNLSAQLAYMEAELGKAPWFAGKVFTAADIQMSFVLEAAAARGGLGKGYPLMSDWLTRIHARAAYQKALQRGGEYSLLT